jgi:hypothetical protein
MKLGYLLIVAFLAVLMIYACTKGNTAKKPQITLQSITRQVYSADSLGIDSMVATFKFTNSGGTLGNGNFVSIRMRQNQVPASQPLSVDTLYTPIPDFGGVSNGQFRLVFNYDNYLGESASQHFNDTMIFKFFALTPDSLSSDTITSPQIIIFNP